MEKYTTFPDKVDTLLTDCHLVTLPDATSYGIVKDGAIALDKGEIAWVGPAAALPEDSPDRCGKVIHLETKWVTPGFVDCHTHLVYAGNRAGEFEMRLGGASYEEIAKKGGGIVSTVKAVRDCPTEELYKQSLPRLQSLISEGVTTVEIKSGYGLDTASEIKMLEVAHLLGKNLGVTVSPTFLGAHALPLEFKGQPDSYIELVVNEMLPAVAERGLADAVDVFCEKIGFTAPQTERVFQAARNHGLPIKLHGEQLSDQKGAVLASAYGALSVDHLEYVQQDGIDAMAKAGTIATLLPGAYYFLHETQKPPVSRFRKAGVPIAVSTDCNPGSSPSVSPLLMMNMACVLFDMTPLEALAGLTINGARALGQQNNRGSLEVGKCADLAVWDIEEPAELSYRLGGNPCRMVFKGGQQLFEKRW